MVSQIFRPLILFSFLMKHDRTSAARINRYGERGQPFLSHIWRLKDSEVHTLFMMQLLMLLYRVRIYCRIDGPKLNACKAFLINDHSKESNAFSKSIHRIIAGIYSSSKYSMITRILLIFSSMLRLFRT